MNSFGTASNSALLDNNKSNVTKADAEEAIKTLIQYLGDDPNREGLIDTPRRVIKSFNSSVEVWQSDSLIFLCLNIFFKSNFVFILTG